MGTSYNASFAYNSSLPYKGSIGGKLVVTISGLALENKVDVATFRIVQVLTRRGFTAMIRLIDQGNSLTVARFAPVVVMDDVGNTLFSGWANKTRQITPSSGQRLFDLSCSDAVDFLQSRIHAKRYVNQYTTDVARDLVLNALPSVGITANNTTAGQGPIISIDANRNTTASLLTRVAKLASRASNQIFDWYVDFNRDLHFFYSNQAPASGVTLVDTAPTGNQLQIDRGSFWYESDDSQLGNTVVVRGGSAISRPITDNFTGSGIASSFALSQAPDIINAGLPQIYVAGVLQTVQQGTGTTATAQWVVNQASGSQNWYISTGTAATPGFGVKITATYQYDVPLFAQAQNSADVTALSSLPNTGVFHRYIADGTILDLNSALARGNAELAQFGQPYINAHAETELVTTGTIAGLLQAGKTVNVVHSQLGINTTLLIVKATIQAVAPTRWKYLLDLSG